jgi:hypothetical protein
LHLQLVANIPAVVLAPAKTVDLSHLVVLCVSFATIALPLAMAAMHADGVQAWCLSMVLCDNMLQMYCNIVSHGFI